MRTRFWIPGLILLVLLAACAPADASPTPTIVPLDLTAQPELPTATPTATRPTATPIPFPSPTPTRTPRPAPAAAAPAAAVTATPAPEAQVEVVSVGLNIRQGPGLNYPVISTASMGDRFPISGADPSRSWFQVQLAGGRVGWISGKPDYTELIGSPDNIPVLPAPAGTGPVSAAPVQESGTAGGDRLVLTTGSGGELYVVNVDGSGLRRLAGGVIDPDVSPDGRQVAFTRWDGAEFGTLYTINLDGSSERALIGESRQAKSPTWSPDGREIVFSFQKGGLRDPQPDCENFDADDGIRIPDNVTITKTHFNAQSGILTICFIPKEDLQWSLRRVNVETGEFEDMPVDLYSYNPAWDPNQPWRVIYAGEKGLMALDVNQGTQQPLTTDLRDNNPVFSPDGKKLALTYQQHDHWEVYTLDLETGTRSRLTKPPILADPQYNSASPAWSPDGSQLAFLTDRSGQWEVWVMNADGSNQRPLLPPEVQNELGLEYYGMNEHMLNWVE